MAYASVETSLPQTPKTDNIRACLSRIRDVIQGIDGITDDLSISADALAGRQPSIEKSEGGIVGVIEPDHVLFIVASIERMLLEHRRKLNGITETIRATVG
jgi:hypothetical protein